MMRIRKIVLTCLVLFCTGLSAVADKGIGRKTKNKAYSLSLNTNFTLRSSLNFNLKSGVTYKGSMLGLPNSAGTSTAVATYQRGNNIYITPYKQKIAVPELRQGYAGMKLIIRSN